MKLTIKILKIVRSVFLVLTIAAVFALLYNMSSEFESRRHYNDVTVQSLGGETSSETDMGMYAILMFILFIAPLGLLAAGTHGLIVLFSREKRGKGTKRQLGYDSTRVVQNWPMPKHPKGDMFLHRR